MGNVNQPPGNIHVSVKVGQSHFNHEIRYSFQATGCQSAICNSRIHSLCYEDTG